MSKPALKRVLLSALKAFGAGAGAILVARESDLLGGGLGAVKSIALAALFAGGDAAFKAVQIALEET